MEKLDGIVYPICVEDYSRVLHSFSEPQPFVDFALDSLLRLVDAHAGSLFLWDERTKELVMRAHRSANGARFRDVRIQLREGVSGWVADKGVPVLVTDVEQDDRFNGVRRNGNYQSSSFICLPLVADNKLLGVANITEKENRLPFSKSDSERAEVFLSHVALAYENLRLRIRLQEENNSLRCRVKELEETLKGQEGLVSVGKLASNLAHELSNPLDAIRRFVNLALDEVMEDSLSREYLLKAKKGIRRAVRVMRGLLQFSRDSFRTTVRTAELHELINGSLESFGHDARFEQIDVEKQFVEGAFFIRDCGLQLVFKNLFENAAYAMNGSDRKASGTLAVSTKRNGSHVTVLVRDTGRGISEEIRPRVFEPFFTTKNQGEGTGIGLAICRDIVERCGGQISLGSEVDEGTEFSIVLPYYEREGQIL